MLIWIDNLLQTVKGARKLTLILTMSVTKTALRIKCLNRFDVLLHEHAPSLLFLETRLSFILVRQTVPKTIYVLIILTTHD